MRSIEKGWYVLRRSVYQIRWLFINFSWSLVSPGTSALMTNKAYSIGITTYVERYERFLKPLVRRLVILFPDTEIIIAVNGYYDQLVQNKYLNEIDVFLKQFPNIKMVSFNEPQSLSKLWNLIILNSIADQTFLLNDDVHIGPKLRGDLEISGILKEGLALINESWSHFLISKNIIRIAGWFDERFPALGNEDEDYECRLAVEGIAVKSFKVRHIRNILYITNDYSWNDAEIVNAKYMRANQLFFNSKWDTTEHQENGYVYVRLLGKYARLKEGMETPLFYPVPVLTDP